jgi:hypothetical protein
MTVGYRPCFTVDISFAWMGGRVSLMTARA